MSGIGSLPAWVEETERRYRERRAERESWWRGLEREGVAGANAEGAIRERLSRSGMGDSRVRGIVENGFSERVLGKNDLMPVSYLALGLARARSVGRIHMRDSGGRSLGFGTGFLVSRRLLLTNNHVLESGRDASLGAVEFDFETLPRWHEGDPATEYERHRNQAIFEKQGNRNPLIDYPEWAGRIEFSIGLG